ncbi:MAG: hypothetical protein PVI86_04920 [Phycisphaerae bacterium]|jgi:hypothetical protein
MKVAILSESAADEAALRVLIDGILKVSTEPVAPLRLRSRGWPSVRDILPSVLKHLHYQTDAEALVVVVDSDNSPIHSAEHDAPNGQEGDCRLCQIRSLVQETLSRVKAVPNRQPLKTAIGLAAPCIEAWYCCGDADASEAAWARQLETGTNLRQRRLELKRKVYGTDRPSAELETRCAVEQAKRLVQDLPQLERQFPNGFGPLARDVRGWASD